MVMDLIKGQKAVVIGERYNPQLGTYLTGPYIVNVKRVNKNTYSIAYENGEDYHPTLFCAGSGVAKKVSECVYGSMSYALYTPAMAVAKLNCWADKEKDPNGYHAEKYRKNADFIKAEFGL